jgi:hypothetical protein
MSDDKRDFVIRLTMLHAEAGRLGLFSTMHKIHEAVKQLGYELAGTPELYSKIEKVRRKRVQP